jgi:hypothetical protein
MMGVFRSLWLYAYSGLAALLLCVAPFAAHADVLAQWNPAGTVQSSSPLPPSVVSPNLGSAGNLTLGPGLTDPGPFANAFVGNNWPSGALDTNDYLSFAITGNVTYQSVVFSLYNNFDGSGNWELRSSVDSFASTLASGTFSGIFAGGELISADVSSLGTQAATVVFRLYTYNNSGTTNPLQRGIRGTGGLGMGLTLNGTASGGGPPPPPPPPPVTPIATPTLSDATLFALTVIVGFIGIGLSRRRQA